MAFLILLAILFVIALPLIAISKAGDALEQVQNLRRQNRELESRLKQLEQSQQPANPVPLLPTRPQAPPISIAEAIAESPPPLPFENTTPRLHPTPIAPPPRVPPPERPMPQPSWAKPEQPEKPAPAPYVPKPFKPTMQIDWEKFLGVKLFSWIGGLALFLGIVFFVKYAFENNLISPATRVGLGLGIGLVLLLLGPFVKRWKDYTVLTQSLCATGVVTLYGVTYAAHAYYALPAFNTSLTFVLLVLITSAAFYLAVHLNALVVAVLGMLGGFLTPIAVSTGQDRPLALFGYIALLDLGLMAVVLRRPWRFLIPLAAYGTVIMQMGWLAKFFVQGNYADGNLTFLPMGIGLGFQALFLLMLWKRRTDASVDRLHFTHAALVLASSAFCLAVYCLGFSSIGLRPGLIFGYLALLDLGLVAIAFLGQFRLLMRFIALGTLMVQAGWWLNFFQPGLYFSGANTLVPMAMEMGFLLLFGAVAWFQRKADPFQELPFCDATLIAGASAFTFVGYALHWNEIGQRPWLMFGFVALVEILVLIQAWRSPLRAWVAGSVGAVAFLLLGIWSSLHLTEDRLVTALVLYVAFGLLGVLAPLLWNRYGPKLADQPATMAPWLTPLSLAMCAFPLFQHPHASGGIWLAVIFLNLTGLILAKERVSLICQAVSTVITLTFSVVWLSQLPITADALGTWLLLLSGLAVFLLVQGIVLFRRKTSTELGLSSTLLAVIWPYLLLSGAEVMLPLTSPNLLFTAVGVLSAALLAVAWWRKLEILTLATYLGAFCIQALWLLARPMAEIGGTLLAWQSGFTLVFFAYPFLRASFWTERRTPWLASGLALLLQSLLMLVTVKYCFPNFSRDYLGILPAAFAALSGVGLWLVTKHSISDPAKRLWRLAWFGGITLFFFTAIFPLQFHRQWITISWALEGAALIWLFRRVPHKGLWQLGFALLVTAFLRLVFNPAILVYAPHQPTPIFNWFLYAYTISAAAMYAAARWWPEGVSFHDQIQPRPALLTMMGVTLFALVNLEIADYFTPAANYTVSFDFSNNLARDVTFSIAWALFGLICLIIGFWHRQRGPRYAGLGLLAVTLLKLFFHDLAQVQSVYRIVVLIGVALIVLLASFLYQRFFASRAGEKTELE